MKYIIIIAFIVFILISIMVYYDEKIIKLETEKIKLENKLDEVYYGYNSWKDKALELQRANWQLKSALEFYQRPDIKGGIEINEDIKQAVKYCMIKSHPDKGGSTEDFIKFRELYNKLK